MTFRVVLHLASERDLTDIAVWIAGHASRAVAERYVDRIEARIASLREFPHRGKLLPMFGDDIRDLSFERRLLIMYRVADDHVVILRIVSVARDLSDLSLP